MESKKVSTLRSEDHHDVEMAMVCGGNVANLLAPQLPCDSVCAFLKQENNTSELEERSKSATKLCALIIFYLIAMVVEIVGGVKANSLAVMTDAAHLAMDVAGFSISLFSVWASGWEATSHYSFGFHRLEVLGALISMQLIWLVSAYLIYEAVYRMVHKCAEVNGTLMFGVAAFGFIINLIVIICLGHDHAHAHHACGDKDHDHHNQVEVEKLGLVAEGDGNYPVPSSPAKTKILNINLQGAYLHVMADLIQSVGVMIAGGVMWIRPDWCVVDLICTFVFSAFSAATTLPMIRDVFGILMERTPSEINVGKLESDVKCIYGVQTVYDLHVWAITTGKLALCCHLIAEPGVKSSEILDKVRDYCKKTYRIHHVTVQIE
ncbi:hypothetical protein Pint_32662 [Pistacia integerrima]|uniref:Uncharacterized protein n=1 Tax=Pistacia integerrima TaxID=434235 RepID=A0ACC0XLS8_9ROSI|nr:hypothetical protein Pint_32662 [Pistacia integerrima]